MEKPQPQRIITYHPKFIKIIEDDKILEILKDENHYPILKILKKQPMTVKELEIEYEKVTGKKKSDKTIYRYLKNLEDVGLVMGAGQLVTPGKTATETIYSRTAMGFYIRDRMKNIREGEMGQKIVKAITALLNHILGTNYDENEIDNMLKHIDKSHDEMMEKLSDDIENNALESIENLDLREINTILEFTTMIGVLIKNKDLINEL